MLNPVLPPPRTRRIQTARNAVDVILNARSAADLRLYEWEDRGKTPAGKTKWYDTDTKKTRYQISKPGTGRGGKKKEAGPGADKPQGEAEAGAGGKQKKTPTPRKPKVDHNEVGDRIEKMLGSDFADADVGALREELLSLTGAQLDELKKRFTVKGGRTKADVAGRIAGHAGSSRKSAGQAVEKPSPAQPAPEAAPVPGSPVHETPRLPEQPKKSGDALKAAESVLAGAEKLGLGSGLARQLRLTEKTGDPDKDLLNTLDVLKSLDVEVFDSLKDAQGNPMIMGNEALRRLHQLQGEYMDNSSGSDASALMNLSRGVERSKKNLSSFAEQLAKLPPGSVKNAQGQPVDAQGVARLYGEMSAGLADQVLGNALQKTAGKIASGEKKLTDYPPALRDQLQSATSENPASTPGSPVHEQPRLPEPPAPAPKKPARGKAIPLPEWMQGDPTAERLSQGVGESIETGADIGVATVTKLNPPSKKYPHGSVVLTDESGRSDVFDFTRLRDNIRKGHNGAGFVSKQPAPTPAPAPKKPRTSSVLPPGKPATKKSGPPADAGEVTKKVVGLYGNASDTKAVTGERVLALKDDLAPLSTSQLAGIVQAMGFPARSVANMPRKALIPFIQKAILDRQGATTRSSEEMIDRPDRGRRATTSDDAANSRAASQVFDDYHAATSRKPSARKPAAKPPAARKERPAPQPVQTPEGGRALATYHNAASDAVTAESIEALTPALMGMAPDELSRVAEGMGISGLKGNRAAKVAAIKERISKRKGATQRAGLIDRDPRKGRPGSETTEG